MSQRAPVRWSSLRIGPALQAPARETWYPSGFRRPTHLARRVAKRTRRCRSSYRWASNARKPKHTDDDSRYRFASYELSTPEHSRRGRPSSPCPAVAGANPRDDGLRVASRLPPRSRLGAVMYHARGRGAASVVPPRTQPLRLGSRQHARVSYVASGARPASPSPRSVYRARAAAAPRSAGARVGDRGTTTGRAAVRRRAPVRARIPAHTIRGRSCAVTGPGRGRSTLLGVGPPTRVDRRSDARAPVRGSAPSPSPASSRPAVAGAQLL